MCCLLLDAARAAVGALVAFLLWLEEPVECEGVELALVVL